MMGIIWLQQSQLLISDLRSLLKFQPCVTFLAGGFSTFFIFTPILGNMTHFDEHIFQLGWFNHQPVLFHGVDPVTLGRGFFLSGGVPKRQTKPSWGFGTGDREPCRFSAYPWDLPCTSGCQQMKV